MLSQFVPALSPTDKYWLVEADAFANLYRPLSKDKGFTVSLFRFLVPVFLLYVLPLKHDTRLHILSRQLQFRRHRASSDQNGSLSSVRCFVFVSVCTMFTILSYIDAT